MQQMMSEQILERENVVFQGTGGRSQAKRSAVTQLVLNDVRLRVECRFPSF